MRRSLVAACLTVWAMAGFSVVPAADKPEEEVDSGLPPAVIKTEPGNRAKDVDSSLQEIKVTFDRPMQAEKSWSWIRHANLGVYPGYQGSAEPHWEDDGRTCVLPVKLSPGTWYAIGVNSFRHTGFRGKDGAIAVPHVWVFQTQKAE